MPITPKKISLVRPIKKVSFNDLHKKNWIGNSTAIFKKSSVSDINYSEIRKRQDYAFWLSLLNLNKEKYALSPANIGVDAVD